MEAHVIQGDSTGQEEEGPFKNISKGGGKRSITFYKKISWLPPSMTDIITTLPALNKQKTPPSKCLQREAWPGGPPISIHVYKSPTAELLRVKGPSF